MNIHELRANVVADKLETKAKAKAENKPQLPISDNKEIVNEKGAEALKNYFIGTQHVAFKGFPCDTGEFNHNMAMVPCACCGKKMLAGNENVDKFAQKLTQIRGEERNNFIDDTMDIYRPVEKTIIRGMKDLGTKYPEKTTFELCAEMAKDPETILKNGQLAVLDDVDAKAKELYGEDNKISKFVKSQKPLINGQENNPKFNRADFVEKMDDLTTEMGDDKAKGKVLNVAIDMPFEDDYFQKMTKKIYQPRKFIRTLYCNAVKTAEHIHPKSLGGPNNTENYMSECNECNENRQNYDLNSYWMSRYPSMPYNVQQFCDDVTEKVVSGEIGPHFVDYPKDLKVAVESETKGAITLKVLNPEEINKKRAEKGLEPLPQPTQDSVEKARREQRKKPHEEVPLPSPRPAKAEPQKKVA